MTDVENRATSGPILRTFVRYAASSMVGLISISTLSLVDGMFVGKYVGSDALAAITLLLPCLTVLYAISLMFGIGGSVAAGRHIGAGNGPAASVVFSQIIVATLLTTLSFAFISLLMEQQLYWALNVPDSLRPLVSDYFGVVRWVLVVQMTTMVLYYFVRADGHPLLATTALVVGALCNIGFDVLFVVQLGLGLRGAAYAIAISQIIQALVLSRYFFESSRSLWLSWKLERWQGFGRVAYNGISEFINEISVGLIFWLLNHLLLVRAGVDAIAAFTVVNYFIFLSLMLSYGVADALHPLVSQNYGAGEQKRIRDFLLTALGCSLALGAALAWVLVQWRTEFTGFFLAEEDAAVADHAASLVLVLWPLFLVNGTNIVFSCYLTAIERATPSALIAVMRGLVLPASLLLFFDSSVGPQFVVSSAWSFLAALPVAEWLTFGLAFWLCYRHRPDVLEAAVP